MRYSTRIRPIGYLETNAADALAQVVELREPMVITRDGEAKAVLQDIASFQETQETLALLAMLALGEQDIAAGRFQPASGVIARLRAKTRP
jgi:prevent-host-death family protein